MSAVWGKILSIRGRPGTNPSRRLRIQEASGRRAAEFLFWPPVCSAVFARVPVRSSVGEVAMIGNRWYLMFRVRRGAS